MQKKIFLWFVLIVVLPSGIIYFVMNHLLIRYVINQQIETNNQLIREMRKNLDTKLLHYQQLTMQFYLNDEAMAEIDSALPVLECKAIQTMLDGFVNSNRLIASAYLVMEKGIVSSGTGIQHIELINDTIQPILTRLEGRIYWTQTYPMVSNFGLEDTFFFGGRHIRKNQKPIATLLLGFNSQFFDDFFQYTPFTENQTIMLTNSQGYTIASNQIEKPLANLVSTPSSVENGKYVTLTSNSSASDWTISLTFDTHEISRELTYLRDMFNLSAILDIIFFLMISLLISRRLTKPIQALTGAVKKVGEGIIDVQVDIDHIDEIKQLSIGFNAMTDRIQKLLEEVKHEEENKRKAYMQTLQLQLTPHLLYNSLNTIRWMAQINGQENIKDITRALTRYLRSLSDIESEYISLRKELQLVEDYAVIQRFRYSDFTIVQRVSDDLLNCQIHKLMVVNLVENSIIHGIADLAERGVITISATSDSETLFITVADNGIGIPNHISRSLAVLGEDGSHHIDSKDSHTGLRNIQDRLTLHHGLNYSLIVTSEPGKGCSITIPMPIIFEKDDQISP
ncbi:MAG: histidine kinase [Sphaerochaetaceae bacterium]|nr:histidine kinase [Sphaerochaetaceae bacterium]